MNIPEQFLEAVSDSHVLICLDRDGTLAPITECPEDSKVPESTKCLLQEMSDSAGISVCFVSARSIDFLKNDLSIAGAIYAGNYGLEIQKGDGARWVHPAAEAARLSLQKLFLEIQSQFSPAYHLDLENHQFSLCLHYHRTAAELRPEVASWVKTQVSKYSDVVLHASPTSWEILPALPWTKADALNHIVRSFADLPLAVFYAGDSGFDEPAMKYVNELRNGLSVRICKSEHQPTEAQLKILHFEVLPSLLKEIFEAVRSQIVRPGL